MLRARRTEVVAQIFAMDVAAQAARRGALITVAARRGTLKVTGPDRASWLNGIVTCDVARVSPEAGAIGLALNKTGKILSDLCLVASADALFMASAPGTERDLASHFERMLVMEDAEIAECSSDHVWMFLHGPLGARLGRETATWAGGASGEVDWSGLGGAALVIPRARLGEAVERLAGVPQVHVATEDEWETHRLERALPEFLVDYGTDDNPHEAGLDQRAVCWTKGCYLGQEVVCMQGMRGRVKRRVVALVVEGDVRPARGDAVRTADGSQVGEVTSAARGQAVPGWVALARVSGSVADDKPAVLVVDSPARIVERPDAA